MAVSVPQRITAALAELRLARRNGNAEWINRAARDLDLLLDQLPRKATRTGGGTRDRR